MSDPAAIELNTYLRRLGWGLDTLAKSDREAIVDETRAHVLDRIQQGAPLNTVLTALGSPEIYARRFIDEAEILSALANQRPLTVLGVVARRVHRSAVAGLAFVVVLILYTFAGLCVTLSILKAIDPAHVGLWVGPGRFVFGRPETPDGRHEVLGYGIFPLTLVAVACAWFLSRLILLWALRSQKPRN